MKVMMEDHAETTKSYFIQEVGSNEEKYEQVVVEERRIF